MTLVISLSLSDRMKIHKNVRIVRTYSTYVQYVFHNTFTIRYILFNSRMHVGMGISFF